MVRDDLECVLDLATEVLGEFLDRASQRAQRCGCHACKQSLAELRAWLYAAEHAPTSAPVYDRVDL